MCLWLWFLHRCTASLCVSREASIKKSNIVNIYAPNIGAPKYIKKILEDFKKDADSNTIIVGDFNTPLSKMDRSSK